jgi:tetratricopeptide (TPR) repeat protein
MNCPECGHNRVPEGARFCPNCGAAMRQVPESRLVPKIIDYRTLIERSTEEFVGRQWVRDAIDGFLQADGPRHFVLLGEPGSGKTAFMADLVRRRGYPHHFIGKGSLTGLAASLDWRNPIRFAESIGYQLLRDYGGWIMDWDSWGIEVKQEVRELEGLLIGAQVETLQAVPRRADRPVLTVDQEVERYGPAGQMIGVYIEKYVMDVEQIVRQLLLVPLIKIAGQWPEQQVVLVVDGLDEAERYSDPRRSILKMLPDGGLPGNVRLLLSSRPGEHLAPDFSSQAQVFWLSEDQAGSRNPGILEDAREFVDRLAQEEQIRQMLRRAGVEAHQLCQRVATLSQGSFLYLYHYAHGLRDGDESLLDLDALPEGLQGIYADFMAKIKDGRGDVSWDGAYKPVLGALAVAREPLARRQIASFAGVKQGTVGTILMQLKQFLDSEGQRAERRYSVYHRSFGEYLVSEENEDYIGKEDPHKGIVEFYRGRAPTWEQVDWRQVDGYGLLHLPNHLYAIKGVAPYDQELYDLMCLSFMREKQRRTLSFSAFADDLGLVMQAASSEGRLNPVQVVRCSLIYATLGAIATNVSAEVLGALTLVGQGKAAEGYALLMQERWLQSDAYLQIGKAYLGREEFEESREVLYRALATAEHWNIPTRMDALAEIARAFTQARHADGLRQVLDTVLAVETQEFHGAVALKEIAIGLAQLGDWDGLAQALDALRGRGWPNLSMAALAETALAMARANEGQRLSEAAEQVLALTREVESYPATRIGVLSTVSRVLLQLDRPEKAREAAMLALSLAKGLDTSDLGYDAAPLSGLAQALVELGDKDELAWLLAHVRERAWWWVDEVFLPTAEVLAQKDRAREAVEMINQVVEVADGVDAQDYQAGFLLKAAHALIQSGETRRAAEIVDRVMGLLDGIEPQESRAEVALEAARVLARIGKQSKAVAAIEHVLEMAEGLESSDRTRSEVLRPAIEVLALAGEMERSAEVAVQALTTLGDIEDGESRGWELVGLARALAELGMRSETVGVADRAFEITGSIESVYMRTFFLSEIARTLKQVGEDVKATEVLLKTTQSLAASGVTVDLQAKLAALAEIARAMARVGRREEALEIAHHVSPQLSQVEDDAETALVLDSVSRARTEVEVGTKAARQARATGGDQRAFCAAFDTARRTSRGRVFEVLEQGADLLASLDRGQTLWEVYQAAMEAESWWVG